MPVATTTVVARSKWTDNNESAHGWNEWWKLDKTGNLPSFGDNGRRPTSRARAERVGPTLTIMNTSNEDCVWERDHFLLLLHQTYQIISVLALDNLFQFHQGFAMNFYSFLILTHAHNGIEFGPFHFGWLWVFFLPPPFGMLPLTCLMWWTMDFEERKILRELKI